MLDIVQVDFMDEPNGYCKNSQLDFNSEWLENEGAIPSHINLIIYSYAAGDAEGMGTILARVFMELWDGFSDDLKEECQPLYDKAIGFIKNQVLTYE